MEEAQYAIKNGRCVLSRVQLPHEQGTVTIVASHTRYPDLQTKIQLQVQSFDLELISLEDGSEPILSYPISSVERSNPLIPSQLAAYQPSHLVTYVKDVVKKTKGKVGDIYSEMVCTEQTLQTLYSRESLLEEEINTLKDEIGFTVGPLLAAEELTCQRIREKIGTAASVVCSRRECFMDDVVGVVALLGTVPDWKIARPYNGGFLRSSPQKELDLAWPYPHVKKPKGFKGFAVNMINLSDVNLSVTTNTGHGLRETLFYSLFGELQVYETRDDMSQAMPYLNGAAVSLDGGVIKGKGKLLLGYSDPKITFPVVSGSPKTQTHGDVMKTRVLDSKMKLLETIKTMKKEHQKVHEELINKFNKRKRKFDEISEILTQPSGTELVLYNQVKAGTLDL